MKTETTDDLLRALRTELQDIKKILIVYASKSGATSDDIGKVLGVGGSQIRNILAGGKSRKLKDHVKGR